MRVFLRVSVVVFLALGALIYNAGDIVDPWIPWNNFGITTSSSGVITTVDEYAASKGLRVGDVVDLARMTFVDRSQIVGTVPSSYGGRRIVLPLRSGRTVALVAHPRKRSLADNLTDLASVTALVAYTLIAATLVLLRPTPATWMFFIFSAGFLYNGNQDLQYFPPWMTVLLSYVTLPVLAAIGPVAFFSFALRFPDARPQGRWRRAERVAWWIVAPVLAALNVASSGVPLVGAPFPQEITGWVQFLIAALYVPGIVVLIARYSGSAQAERTRLRWVVGAFAIAFLPYVFFTAAENAAANVISLPVANIVQAWLIVAPVALAYTILKHRLFDIRFVVSRALIFGFMTTLMVGILALADWGFGKWLEQSRFQLIAEAALALALGFSITTVHKRMEHALNRVIFRAQAVALAAIRRFTHEVDLIGDPNQLLAQTLETLRTRVDAEYVAVFSEEGTTFIQAQPGVDSLPAMLSANDLAVLRLRRWSEPFECDVPQHVLRGALLLPMTARTRLVGFIACGPKTDHTHYVPEETDTLQALAHRAGAGYAWLTMRPVIGSQVIHRSAAEA